MCWCWRYISGLGFMCWCWRYISGVGLMCWCWGRVDRNEELEGVLHERLQAPHLLSKKERDFYPFDQKQKGDVFLYVPPTTPKSWKRSPKVNLPSR